MLLNLWFLIGKREVFLKSFWNGSFCWLWCSCLGWYFSFSQLFAAVFSFLLFQSGSLVLKYLILLVLVFSAAVIIIFSLLFSFLLCMQRCIFSMWSICKHLACLSTSKPLPKKEHFLLLSAWVEPFLLFFFFFFAILVRSFLFLFYSHLSPLVLAQLLPKQYSLLVVIFFSALFCILVPLFPLQNTFLSFLVSFLAGGFFLLNEREHFFFLVLAPFSLLLWSCRIFFPFKRWY